MSLGSSPKPASTGLPKLPVAGLMIRLLAFIMDIFFVVIVIIGGLKWALPDLFWTLGRWSPYFTGLITFLYFVLLNGPVGKGKTFGKYLLRLSVTDYDGTPPNLRQTALRTVILIPLFVTVPIAETLLGSSHSDMEFYTKSLITTLPFFAIIGSTLLTIPFNPFKQGLHDYLTRTLVRRAQSDGQPYPTFEELQDEVGDSWPKFYRQPQYSAIITFVVVYALFAFLTYPRFSPEERAILNRFHTMESMEGYAGTQSAAILPFPTDIYVQSQEHPVYPKELLDEAQNPTTGTLNLVLPVYREAGWPYNPGDPALASIHGNYLQAYYDEIIVPALQLYATNPDQLSPELREFIDKCQSDSLFIRTVFIERVFLTPFPYPMQRFKGSYAKTFLPLIAAENEENP